VSRKHPGSGAGQKKEWEKMLEGNGLDGGKGKRGAETGELVGRAERGMRVTGQMRKKEADK